MKKWIIEADLGGKIRFEVEAEDREAAFRAAEASFEPFAFHADTSPTKAPLENAGLDVLWLQLGSRYDHEWEAREVKPFGELPEDEPKTSQVYGRFSYNLRTPKGEK